jgi:hypothetical protein
MYAPPERFNDIVAAAAAIAPDDLTFTYFTMNEGEPRPYHAVRATSTGFERTPVRADVKPAGFPMMARVEPDRPGGLPALVTVWLEGQMTEGFQVLISRSDDEGRTWSGPVTVTSDEPVRLRTHPNVVSDRSGVLAVSWFESRDGGPCGDVRVVFSSDGGRTFDAGRRFPRGTASCPTAGPLKAIVDRWRGGGDYSGMSSPTPGVFDLVWADVRGDGHQVRFARVRRR